MEKSFEEDLFATIKAVEAERDLKEAALATFDEDWSTRKREIYAIFERAVPLLRASRRIGVAEAKIKNGSVSLSSGLHQLEFSPRKTELDVACSSTFKAPPESYSLDQLTPSVIEAEVKEFARSLASGATSNTPVIFATQVEAPWDK